MSKHWLLLPPAGSMTLGAFHSTKNYGLKFRRFYVANGTAFSGWLHQAVPAGLGHSRSRCSCQNTKDPSRNGEWDIIFWLFQFSGTLGQPCEVYPNFRNIFPEISVPFDSSPGTSGNFGWMESAHWCPVNLIFIYCLFKNNFLLSPLHWQVQVRVAMILFSNPEITRIRFSFLSQIKICPRQLKELTAMSATGWGELLIGHGGLTSQLRQCLPC